MPEVIHDGGVPYPSPSSPEPNLYVDSQPEPFRGCNSRTALSTGRRRARGDPGRWRPVREQPEPELARGDTRTSLTELRTETR